LSVLCSVARRTTADLVQTEIWTIGFAKNYNYLSNYIIIISISNNKEAKFLTLHFFRPALP
jgi:hypothetical protein